MNPLAYCPFGLGPRICPGERFAWVEMKLLVALVLQKFTVTLACDPTEVVPLERFVMMAKNDVLVTLTPRTHH